MVSRIGFLRTCKSMFSPSHRLIPVKDELSRSYRGGHKTGSVTFRVSCGEAPQQQLTNATASTNNLIVNLQTQLVIGTNEAHRSLGELASFSR
jgi:hypothetical protein